MTTPLSTKPPVAQHASHLRTRLLVLAGGGVVGLLLFGWVLVMWPHLLPVGFLKPKIEQALATQTGRKVTVERVHCLSLVPPTLGLAGFKISEDPQFPPQDFFSAQELALRVPLLVLLGGKLRAESAVGTGLNCALVRRKDGIWNWESIQFLKQGKAGMGLGQIGFELSSFEVRNSRFTVSTEESEAKNEKGEPVPGTPATFTSEKIDCRGKFTDRGLKFEKMEADVAGGRFSGSVLLAPNQQNLDFEIKGELKTARMEKLLAALSAQSVIVGELSGRCELSGKFSTGQPVGRTLSGSGHLDIKDGEFPSVRVGELHKEPEEKEKTESKGGLPFPLPKLPQQLPFPMYRQAEGPPVEAAPVPPPTTPASKESDSPAEPQKGTKFHILSCDFSILPGAMKTTKIVCQTAEQTDVSGDGEIDYSDPTLTTVDYRLSASLTQEMVEKLKQTRPAAAVLSNILGAGRVLRVPVRVKGEIDNPAVEIDYTGFARPSERTTADSIIPKIPLPF
ncbi:MAG: AsmA family protein [Blastocatellia bacterium]|nr:AsmA family protein [Blastocatellia bacterium]